ncbi:MAG: ABC transporter substrate-binding protein [Candidatus Cloacimonetes bacterium]|nr:ABC transporter substrate-binding protein [Candidatus Cloacimonadota bacterium]
MKYFSIFVLVLIMMTACSQQKDVLIVGLIRPSLNHLPVQIALQKGFLDSTRIKIHYFSSGWETNEALTASRIDVAVMPFTYAWQDVAAGYPVRIASFLERESDGIICNKSIRSVQELNDKKIGVLRASTLDIFARMLLEEHNIKAELVAFRSPMEMAAALTSGEVDALSYYVPPIFRFGDDYRIVRWFSEDYPNHPCCNVITRDETIQLKTKLLSGFLVALAEASTLIPLDHEAVVAGASSFGLTDSTLSQSIKYTQYMMGTEEAGKELEKRAARVMLESKYLSQKVDPEKVYLTPAQKNLLGL